MSRSALAPTVLMLAFLCSMGHAQQATGPILRAVRTTSPITVDGSLSEPVWHQPGFSSFKQLDPVEGGTPSESTVVWIAYDDGALYVAARMYDRSPDSIVTRLSRRDGKWDSDMIMIDIDPYHDRLSGNYFGLSAAGTYFDGTLYNDDWNDDTWDGVWEGAVAIDRLGWTAEMRIPLSQLRFHDADSLVWGVNFRREIARKNERDFIVYTPKNGSGFVSRFPLLTGLNGIHPTQRFEFLPYMTTKAEYLQHLSGDPFNRGSRYVPGMGADLKLGLGSNLTLDGTINPDFGQVEVDPAVVNLSDVETFFSEKRPFFMEGASTFSQFGRGGVNNYWSFNWPNPTFFYSRRIGRPPEGSLPDADYTRVPDGTSIIGAAKVTGKVGDSWNIGAINAVTAREFADIQTSGHRSDVEVEPLTYYGVFRAQKEFNSSRQGLGAIATVTERQLAGSRLVDELNNRAYVGGVDGWTFLDSSKTWVVNGWAVMSSVAGTPARISALQADSRHYFQRPDAHAYSIDSSATSMTGYAGRLYLNKQQGNILVNASFGVVNPKFENNDLGFLYRADIINSHASLGYQWTTPVSWYRQLSISGSAFRSYDFDGDIIWEGLFALVNMELPNFYNLSLDWAYNPVTVNQRRTRGGPVMLNPKGYQIDLSVQTDTRKNTTLQAGGFLYRDLVDTWSVYATLEWRPTTNFSLSIGPEYDFNPDYAMYVTTVADPYATQTFGTRYIMSDFRQSTISANIRVDWTFTPKLSLQLFMQPLISAAKYYDFKELARPRSLDFLAYGAGGSTITREGDTYTVDPDGSGPAPQFSFTDPTFNLRSFRGNAVLRWEYLPGSTLYLVWTQSRSDVEDIGDFQFRHSFRRLLDAQPDNIFMVKMTYWWGR